MGAVADYTSPEEVATRVNAGVDTTSGMPATPATAEDVSPEVIADAITDAASKIDSYLGSRYAVPFDPVPAQVTSWATAIAAWYATLSLNAQAETTANNPVRLRYEAAMADLLLAMKGTIEVVGAAPPVAADAPDDAGATINRFPPLFSPDEFGLSFYGGVPIVGGYGYNPFTDQGGTG